MSDYARILVRTHSSIVRWRSGDVDELEGEAAGRDRGGGGGSRVTPELPAAAALVACPDRPPIAHAVSVAAAEVELPTSGSQVPHDGALEAWMQAWGVVREAAAAWARQSERPRAMALIALAAMVFSGLSVLVVFSLGCSYRSGVIASSVDLAVWTATCAHAWRVGPLPVMPPWRVAAVVFHAATSSYVSFLPVRAAAPAADFACVSCQPPSAPHSIRRLVTARARRRYHGPPLQLSLSSCFTHRRSVGSACPQFFRSALYFPYGKRAVGTALIGLSGFFNNLAAPLIIYSADPRLRDCALWKLVGKAALDTMRNMVRDAGHVSANPV